MKKILSVLLVLMLVVALAACKDDIAETKENNEETVNTENNNETPDDNTENTSKAVMTFEEYSAAEIDAEVVVETYVQANQSWWEDKITLYCQGPDGAYFVYELSCSEEDAAKLVPGTKIRITGTKSAFAGEIEIMYGTFEFVEGADTYIAEPADLTALLGTAEIIGHMNELAVFNGLTVESFTYKNGEGTDIYLTLSYNGQNYEFCVESYLTSAETDVYKTVAALEQGDVVNVTSFLYWYEGMNPHIIGIEVDE